MTEQQYETKNAIIKSVVLEKGDRGVLQCWLNLDYGGSGQGFGSGAIYIPKSYRHHELKGFAGHFLFRCMEIAGVDDWSKIQGKSIRVKSTHSGIKAIGHIIEDDWFYPSKDFGYEE